MNFQVQATLDNQPQKQPGKNRHKVLLTILIGIMGCGLIYGVFSLVVYSLSVYRNPAKHLTITEINEECVQGAGTEVENVQWTGENELTCIVVFEGTCEMSGLQGDYRIDGDNLILDYDYKFGSSSACLCRYELRYKIRNLERKEYQITVENIE